MRIISIELDLTHAHSRTPAQEALLLAFQSVFPSCAGPSLMALVSDDPTDIARSVENIGVDGSVECRHGCGGVVWVDLVSAARGRRYRVIRNRESLLPSVSILFGDQGSETAARDVLAHLWEEAPDVRVIAFAEWSGEGYITGKPGTAAEILAAMGPHSEAA